MLVTAQEVNRSIRATMDLLHSRGDALKAFDLTEQSFWRSFTAIGLTIPAYIVTLALERSRLGILQPDHALLGSLWLDAIVAFGHVAAFVALPVAMIWISRRLNLTGRYVPFVIVTNWISVVGMLTLSLPPLLLLIGWATPGLASFFTLALAVLLMRTQWFATRETLRISSGLAFCVVCFGLGLDAMIIATMRAIIG